MARISAPENTVETAFNGVLMAQLRETTHSVRNAKKDPAGNPSPGTGTSSWRTDGLHDYGETRSQVQA